MINVAIFSLRDIVKYLLKFIVFIIFIGGLGACYNYMKKISSINYVDNTITAISYVVKGEEKSVAEATVEKVKQISWIDYILTTQLSMKNSVIDKEEQLELEQALVEKERLEKQKGSSNK